MAIGRWRKQCGKTGDSLIMTPWLYTRVIRPSINYTSVVLAAQDPTCQSYKTPKWQLSLRAMESVKATLHWYPDGSKMNRDAGAGILKLKRKTEISPISLWDCVCVLNELEEHSQVTLLAFWGPGHEGIPSNILEVIKRQMPWLRKRRPSHSSILYHGTKPPKEK